MERPTINLGLFTWGTTQHPTATYTSSRPADPKSYNANYLKSNERAITTPYNPSGSVLTQPVSTLYGWTVADEIIKPFPKSDLKNTDTEYNIKNQISHVYTTPEPTIVKGYALKMMKKDSSNEPDKPLSPITNIIEMAQIIADSKKDHKDYQYWLEILSTLKKIDVLKKRRALKSEESDIENKLSQIVITEFEKMRLPPVVDEGEPDDDVSDDGVGVDDESFAEGELDDVSVVDDDDDGESFAEGELDEGTPIPMGRPPSWREKLFKTAKTIGSAILEIGRNIPPLEEEEEDIPLGILFDHVADAVPVDDDIPLGILFDHVADAVPVERGGFPDPDLIDVNIERGRFPTPEIGQLEGLSDYHYAYPDNIIMSTPPNLERSQIIGQLKQSGIDNIIMSTPPNLERSQIIGQLERSGDYHYSYPDNIVMSTPPNLQRSQMFGPEVPVDFYHRRFEYDYNNILGLYDPKQPIIERLTDEPVKRISQVYAPNQPIIKKMTDEPVKRISQVYVPLPSDVINRNLTNLKLKLKNDYPEFPVEQTNKLIVNELVKLKKTPKDLTQLDFDSIEKNIESILNKGLQTKPITTKEWFNRQLNIKVSNAEYISNKKLKKIMKSVGISLPRDSKLNASRSLLDTYLKSDEPYANRLKTLIQNGQLKKSTNLDAFIARLLK